MVVVSCPPRRNEEQIENEVRKVEMSENVADPTGLGLLGLAIVCFVVSTSRVGWSGPTTSVIIPWAVLLGSWAQLIASYFDFKKNNPFGSVVFGGIQNLNTLVDTVRHEIIERYRPGEDDPHLKVLQAAHISDDEYFSHMVLDDLNLIIRDIREAHKKDSESAPQTTVADELKENLEAVENFKGSRDEKLVVLYCKQLGINYKNLSDEEFRWLIRILKKSKKMGTPISQRKKR